MDADYKQTPESAMQAFFDSKINEVRQSLLDSAYPVGSIYTSVNTTNPGTLFGGTWERIRGRFLLGADDSTYQNGGTGGAANVVLSIENMPAHNHNKKTLTGTFSGGFRWYGDGSSAFQPSANTITNGISKTVIANNGEYHYPNGWDTTKAGRRPGEVTIDASHTHDTQGSGTAHENMPPYLVVYMWKRTA